MVKPTKKKTPPTHAKPRPPAAEERAAPSAASQSSTTTHVTTKSRKKSREVHAVVMKVPRAEIKHDWNVLSADARDAVLTEIRARSYAVYAEVAGEARKKEAQDVVENTLKALEKKLMRLPVPPAARESNFKFEKLIEQSSAMEAELVADLHRASVLANEIALETKALAADKEYIETLRHNARAQGMLRAQQQKKIASLLDDDRATGVGYDDDALSIGLMADEDLDEVRTAMDWDIEAVRTRLSAHIASMASNTRALAAVEAAMHRVAEILDESRTRTRKS
ncbi:CENP-Q, a CENPA-CAD centromere complex subunit-domain-containing protein [Limtongia smithiae]|uniref:CENP-Q, a CENPA-CAD centromere complex subunit-domain-containing protein n=1 Tax=Limtongia smithiae TaxID=1125753 RepID=UPI0034CE0E5E